MATVAGVDSSTQSCKLVVCDVDSGEILAHRQVPHPGGTEVPAEAWWQALTAAGDGFLDGVDAISVAAQQHGLVTLDESGRPVRDALLWNDTRSADAAADLVAELGGPQAWAKAVGIVPLAAHTISKLRWMAENEPHLADRTTTVVLPHDYLTWRLRGGPGTDPTTDRGDASGTGYWSPITNHYAPELLTLAFRGRHPELPRVLGPAETAGRTPSGVLVAPGTGDNAAAALGLGIADGDVVVSLGTSGTVFTRATTPSTDPSGAINGFADATGAYLPLVCTLNAARVLDHTATMLGVGAADLDALGRQSTPGAAGLVMLPYLAGERTPNLPHATGSLHGLTADTMQAHHITRAAIEGMLCNIADALDCLDMPCQRIILIGGAARSPLVAEIAAQIIGVTVTVPEPTEYVARGAARQAAWALSGLPEPPQWAAPAQVPYTPPSEPTDGRAIRGAYRTARDTLHSHTAR